MSNHNSKGKFSSFIMGKGFYIALAICLAGAGTAAWVTVNSTMDSIQSAPFGEAPQAAEEQKGAGSQLQNVQQEAQVQESLQPSKETQQVEQKAQDVKKDSSPSAADSSSALTQQFSSEEPASSGEPAMPSELPIVQEKQQPSSYSLPINSKIMAPFSGDNLVENVTMKDWRTHNGIDIKAEVGADILSACNGKVTNIKNDALWGTVVEVTSEDGAVLTYCGFNEKLNVKINDFVETGDKLGVLGEIPCEISLEPHLHFAVKQDGNFVDPLSLIQE